MTLTEFLALAADPEWELDGFMELEVTKVWERKTKKEKSLEKKKQQGKAGDMKGWLGLFLGL
jgi:hypothetical protein